MFKYMYKARTGLLYDSLHQLVILVFRFFFIHRWQRWVILRRRDWGWTTDISSDKYKKWRHFSKKLRAPRFFTWYKANFTWITSSLSLKTVEQPLFKMSHEHHGFVSEHFLKIDCEVWLLAAKMLIARVGYSSSCLCACGSWEVPVCEHAGSIKKKIKK